MSSDTTKSGVPFVAPPKSRKQFNPGGIQPGTFRGSVLQYSGGPPPSDPDADLLAEVKAMDAATMRRWLKQSDNRQRYDEALANKGKTR